MKYFDQFTPGWKEVIRQSRNEAARLGHDYIDPAHLLLGIIRKGDVLAVLILSDLNIKLEDIKKQMENMIKLGNSPQLGVFPQNTDARRIVELAKIIAKELGHNWVGSEHMLLAIIKDNNNDAAKCLSKFNVDYNTCVQIYKNFIESIKESFKKVKKNN